MKKDWIADVLGFWFDELTPQDWFESRPALDNAIKARFLALHEEIAAASPPEVRKEAEPALAAIIALDQFPRNMFRGTARAFATDPFAVELSRNALDQGLDAKLSPVQRQFTAMPLMHSENMADQERCVAVFAGLGNAEALRLAEEHRDIIARFGRFPHRNRVLGRQTSEEERLFLDSHAGYGQ